MGKKTWLRETWDNMRKYVPHGKILYAEEDERDAARKRGLKPINELKLNRILKHGENGYVIVSTNRSEIYSDDKENDLTGEYMKYVNDNGLKDNLETQLKWLRQRNKACDKQLSEFLRGGGSNWSFSPVFGGYHGTDNVMDDFEPSYIIYNYDRSGKPFKSFDGLYKLALDICAKYKQDSVLICEPGKAPNHVDRHGNIKNDASSKKYKFNRDDEEYYTTTKRDKGLVNGQSDRWHAPQRFTSDIIYHQTGPSSYNESMRRRQEGEYFLDDHGMKLFEYDGYRKSHPNLTEAQLREQFIIDLNS